MRQRSRRSTRPGRAALLTMALAWCSPVSAVSAVAAVASPRCPFSAAEMSKALGLTLTASGTSSTDLPGVKQATCDYSTSSLDVRVSVGVSRWDTTSGFERDWKTYRTSFFAGFLGAPAIPVPGAKDGAVYGVNASGKVSQLMLAYTSGRSLVTVNVAGNGSTNAKVVAMKPRLLGVPRKV